MKTARLFFQADLILQDPSGCTLCLPNPTIVIKRQKQFIRSCFLEFSIDTEQYEYIDTHQLFNLDPNLRGRFTGSDFLPELPIEIKVQLIPTLMRQLSEVLQSGTQDVVSWLCQLNQQQPHSPFLSTQNWLALSVYQQQQDVHAGYRTFWKTVHLEPDREMSPKDFVDAILGFLETETNADFSKFKPDIDEGLKLFGTLFDLGGSSKMEDKSAAISQIREQLSPDPTSSSPSIEDEGSLMSIVKEFFIQDNWILYTQAEPYTFSVQVKGRRADWMGVVKVDEIQEQVIFYSLCPFHVSESQRRKVAEFCVKANLGLIIGNFELDFDTGKMRYKTSLDVTGSYLEPTMVRQLVYANILTVDQYLDPLMRMLYGEHSVATAISEAEQPL